MDISDDSSSDDHSTNKNLTDELADEAIRLMKKKLPTYIVNCFIATGYDTLDVIADLTNEDITEIEAIIKNDFVGDDRFLNHATGNTSDMSQFKFQPGHRKRILKFIEEAKYLVKEKTKKANDSSKHRGQKRKASQLICHRGKKAKTTDHEEEQIRGEISDDDNEGIKCNELGMLMDFRQNFVKWQRQQQVPRYKEIKENKDFLLKINTSGNQSISAVLHCFMCGKCLSLGVKSNNILLSNWTRHINSCKGVRNTNTGKITTLKTFFNCKATDISCNKNKSNSVCLTKSVMHNKETVEPILVEESGMADKVKDTCKAPQSHTYAYGPEPVLVEDSSIVDKAKETCEDSQTDGLKLVLVEDSSIVDKAKDTCEDSQTDGHELVLVEDSSIVDKAKDMCKVLQANGETSDPESSGVQVFRLSPPHMQEGKLIHPTTDWSRTARNNISLLKAASDPSQTKLTSFYDIVNKVSNIIKESPQLQQVFGIVQDTHKEAYCDTKAIPTERFSAILKQLLSNAIQNANKAPKGRRHDLVIKKFAISLFILSGPMAYNFFCQNLPEALPCLRTVQRMINSEYCNINEGEFRFDDLLQHIALYKAPKVISVGEDTTRLISKVQYDSDTNRMVGFVLPCDNNGLPITDSFLATSFQQMEQCFLDNDVAKYAFVYMAQPLADNVPAFCLACLGTDNKFDFQLVQKRWSHIVLECHKRGITVISFGADGDSREMKAMLLSSHIFFNNETSAYSFQLNKVVIPKEWYAWFTIKVCNGVSFVQDVVHLAVKLKARLLSPSIVLPLGKFIAGIHHLRLIQQSFGKDVHNIRAKDIDHKDRQNYDAAMHITSSDVLKVLSEIPDAKGTYTYLKIIRYVMDSYLDKSLDVTTRIYKAWYAVFFVRYWRQWLLLNKEYCLSANFITSNAYKCIEINAHSIVTVAMTIRDHLSTDNQCFMPWLLGSQSCEKIFRAARSMTPTFSTVLNFGMLSLLQRLHRIHIQYCLENDSEMSEIKYPRKEIHKDKDGHERSNLYDLCSISNIKIIEAINKAKEEAKRTIESLGMYDLLKKNNFEVPPVPYSEKKCSDDDDDDDDDDDFDDDNNDENDLRKQENELHVTIINESNNLWESSCPQDPNDMTNDITKLNSIGIIENNLCCHLSNLNKSQFKRISGMSLPIYDIQSSSSTKCTRKKSHSPYVEVCYGQRTVYINKTTVVWLLQEGERVSADRLFRVRNKQPFSLSSGKAVSLSNNVSDNGTNPIVSETLSVGDTCVFHISSAQWKMGRILSFSYFLEKTKTSQQYTKTIYNFAEKSKKPVGVLCSWYDPTEIPSKFVITENCTSHRFISVELYICTLASGCFEPLENDKQFPSLVKVKSNVAMAKYLVLTSGTLTTIQNLLQTSATGSMDNPVLINDDSAITDYKTVVSDLWTRCGNITLSKKEKQDLLSGKELNDLHINAFQNLLKSQFTEIGGLHSTLLQSKTHFLKSELDSNINILQIIHMPNHWAALQVFGSDIRFYDSAYTTISGDTLEIIAQLIKTNAKSIRIKLMNVAKQIGVVNCGLHAIATVTCLALGSDPTTVVFNDDELRPHLLNIFETKKISAFPVKKRRKPQNSISKNLTCDVFCYCRLPENGEMVCCDHCQEWFHITCIKSCSIPKEKNANWFCSSCSDRLSA